MRINLRYAAVAGILAASFSTLGPVAVQAGQIPGTPVPGASQTASRTVLPNEHNYWGWWRHGSCRYMPHCRGHYVYYGH
jgi:hypothetical protein